MAEGALILSFPLMWFDILTGYVEQALSQAAYDKLKDGTFAGRIPACKGVVAFGATLRECQDELRSTLEDWILLGLKLGHSLPVIAGIDLNGSRPNVGGFGVGPAQKDIAECRKGLPYALPGTLAIGCGGIVLKRRKW